MAEDDQGVTFVAAAGVAEGRGELVGRHLATWRAYFSQTHMKVAALQASRTLATDQDSSPTGSTSGIERTACAISAILTTVAAIEAAVSEVYITAVDKKRIGDVLSPSETNLAVLWQVMEKEPTKEKIVVALRQVGKTLKPDMACWNNTTDLFALRNILTHYTLGSVVLESSEPSIPASIPPTIEKTLDSKGIARSTLPDTTHFPFVYLNGSCACWAVESSRKFIDNFCRLMEHPSPFSAIEEHAAASGHPSPFMVVSSDCGAQ